MTEEVKKTQNYPGNSHKGREQTVAEKRAPVEKIEGVNVVKRKKPLGRKIAETFSGDDVESVGQYVLFDVVLPAAKDMIFDAFKEGLQRALYGGSSSSRGGGRGGGNNNHTSYNRMYGSVSGNGSNQNSNSPVRTVSRKARATHDFRDLVLDTRAGAQELLDGLDNLIGKYGTASVADLYSILGESGDFTDDKWGWTNLQGADVRHVRGGYLLILPDTIELDG